VRSERRIRREKGTAAVIKPMLTVIDHLCLATPSTFGYRAAIKTSFSANAMAKVFCRTPGRTRPANGCELKFRGVHRSNEGLVP
ncbi:MAG: hypothetical protein DIU65_02860, partial [Proteobacteria bacterium]